jgi:hypothetical protein
MLEIRRKSISLSNLDFKMIKLQLSSYARILPTGRDSFYWMTESSQGRWPALQAGAVAALLATPATSEEILGHFAAGDERDRASGVLDEMIRRGLVEATSFAPHAAQICRESGVHPQSMKRERWAKGAAVLNLANSAEGEALHKALEGAGLPVREDGRLHILAVIDYQDSRIEAVYRENQRAGTPWLLSSWRESRSGSDRYSFREARAGAVWI